MATEDDHSQSIVFKVSEAVGSSLDELNFATEAFGDAVAVGEDEHSQDFFLPSPEGFSEGLEQIKAAGFELFDELHEEADDSASWPWFGCGPRSNPPSPRSPSTQIFNQVHAKVSGAGGPSGKMSMRVSLGPAKSQIIADPILVELYRYWDIKRGDRLFPARASIDPSEIKRCLSRMMLVDVFREPLRFRYRLVGTAASSLISKGELTGKWINRETYGDFAASLQDIYGRVAETGRPVHGSGNLREMDGRDWVTFENVLMPLGDSDDLVTMVMVGIVQTRRKGSMDEPGVESWLVASEPLLPP